MLSAASQATHTLYSVDVGRGPIEPKVTRRLPPIAAGLHFDPSSRETAPLDNRWVKNYHLHVVRAPSHKMRGAYEQ
jgi:hypothetical protein